MMCPTNCGPSCPQSSRNDTKVPGQTLSFKNGSLIKLCPSKMGLISWFVSHLGAPVLCDSGGWHLAITCWHLHLPTFPEHTFVCSRLMWDHAQVRRCTGMCGHLTAEFSVCWCLADVAVRKVDPIKVPGMAQLCKKGFLCSTWTGPLYVLWVALNNSQLVIFF